MTYFYGKGGLRGPPSFYERQTMKPKITMFLCGVLGAILIVSVSLLMDYFWKSKQQAHLYSNLAAVRAQDVQQKIASQSSVQPTSRNLYLENSDMVGWIQIEGTSIDYPVMQTPADPNYYLKHDFMLQSAAFAEMIATDEMFLPKLGVEKRAIFCVIPDNDDTFNFMVSILYTQLFDQLFRLADSTPEFHGTLPVHVRLMMDEFANVATPENFVKILAVARSRNISCDIILQNISQIKSKYKDDWETIIGNCDSLVYLGGNDYSTFEYISKLLGKQTIRTKGQSIGKGSHGSSSDSYQVTGRELMTPDEVRRMKRSDCLVMISGEAPVRDKKYNLFDHPNLKYTPDYRSPRGLLHRAATPIPAPEGYAMPPDYMAQAGTVSLAYVAELTRPEITEDLYDELQEWEESLL